MDGAGVEVEHRAADGGGLPDAHAGAEHELDQVGQVESARPGFAPQARLEIARLGAGQCSDLVVGAGGGARVAHRVVGDGAVADRVGAQAGQGAAGRSGLLRPAAEPELSEGEVEQRRGELAQPQLAEGWRDVQAGRGTIEVPGARCQRAAVGVGPP